MKNPNSYENVMKELEEVNDALEHDKPVDFETVKGDTSDFRWEYAFESVTERHSAYKRRMSHV